MVVAVDAIHDAPSTGVQQRFAASVVSFTVPGLHFVHWGQGQGRLHKQSMHVVVRCGYSNLPL